MGKGLGACEEVSGQLGVQVLKYSPFGGSCRRAKGSPTLGKSLWVDPGDTLVDKKEERGRHLALETIRLTSLLTLSRGGWGGGGGTVEDKGANY